MGKLLQSSREKPRYSALGADQVVYYTLLYTPYSGSAGQLRAVSSSRYLRIANFPLCIPLLPTKVTPLGSEIDAQKFEDLMTIVRARTRRFFMPRGIAMEIMGAFEFQLTSIVSLSPELFTRVF